MKKLVGLTLGLALLLGAWHQLVVVAQGGGGVGSVEEFLCYDANGDGVVNIGDPVALLNWLFLGARSPTSCDVVTRVEPEECLERQDRFRNNADDTLTDVCTGLMWLRRTVDVDGDREPDPLSWRDALAYCENLELAGHADWRLPTIRELHTLVDYRVSGPASDRVLRSVPFGYWSATPDAEPGDAWWVDFNGGAIEDINTAVAAFVRAVRTVPMQ